MLAIDVSVLDLVVDQSNKLTFFTLILPLSKLTKVTFTNTQHSTINVGQYFRLYIIWQAFIDEGTLVV